MFKPCANFKYRQLAIDIDVSTGEQNWIVRQLSSLIIESQPNLEKPSHKGKCRWST